MSENETKTEPKFENEEDEEETVTMGEVLQEEESLEADAKAVLGNSDDKNCTYHSGGYMKRQPLYSCLNCIKDEDSNGSGICLACSYHCHEGHELVELYTKRQFRCDCGNSKMDNECKLANDKRPENERNKYNQNFKGNYCTCNRPYPDPEDTVADVQIQCIICEDWFHGRHLVKKNLKLPKDENYSEMICVLCCEKYHSILGPYSGLSIENVSKEGTSKPNESLDVSVIVDNDEGTSSKNVSLNETTEYKDDTKCKRILVNLEELKAKTLFMPEDWRKNLCKCDDCLKIYQDQNLSFLIDEEDTVHYYESQAKNEGSQYEKGMEALSSMDRVKQVEAIQSYNSMKSNLMEYLQKFAQNGKVVRKEDIQEFFEQMKSNKRPRIEIPENCR